MSFKEPSLLSDKLGYLIINESGAVLSSGGELENDEFKADIFYRMVTLGDKFDKKGFGSGSFTRMSIIYDNFLYAICLSNKKIYVYKRRVVESKFKADDQDIQVPIENSINS